MDSRTRLALGGMATVAASVAVVCVVAMTTSVALADSPGVATGSRSVVVPSPSPTASPAPTPSAVVVSVAPEAPETVPAPEPQIVAAAPQSPSVSADEPDAATEAQFVAAVAATGSWTAVRSWAESRGWSAERVDAWIAALGEKVAERQIGSRTDEQPSSQDSESGNRFDDGIPAGAGNPSGSDLSGRWSGSKREQSRVPPD